MNVKQFVWGASFVFAPHHGVCGKNLGFGMGCHSV